MGCGLTAERPYSEFTTTIELKLLFAGKSARRLCSRHLSMCEKHCCNSREATESG